MALIPRVPLSRHDKAPATRATRFSHDVASEESICADVGGIVPMTNSNLVARRALVDSKSDRYSLFRAAPQPIDRAHISDSLHY